MMLAAAMRLLRYYYSCEIPTYTLKHPVSKFQIVFQKYISPFASIYITIGTFRYFILGESFASAWLIIIIGCSSRRLGGQIF